MKCETCETEITPEEACGEGLCYKCSVDYQRILRGAALTPPQKHIIDPDSISHILKGFEYRSSFQGFARAQQCYNGNGS